MTAVEESKVEEVSITNTTTEPTQVFVIYISIFVVNLKPKLDRLGSLRERVESDGQEFQEVNLKRDVCYYCFVGVCATE